MGERFAESRLLGIPAVVVVGNRFDETGTVEIEYADGSRDFVDPGEVPGLVAAFGAGSDAVAANAADVAANVANADADTDANADVVSDVATRNTRD